MSPAVKRAASGFRTSMIDPLDKRKLLCFRAASKEELESYKAHIRRLTRELRIGVLSRRDVAIRLEGMYRHTRAGALVTVATLWEEQLASLMPNRYRQRLADTWRMLDHHLQDLTPDELSTSFMQGLGKKLRQQGYAWSTIALAEQAITSVMLASVKRKRLKELPWDRDEWSARSINRAKEGPPPRAAQPHELVAILKVVRELDASDHARPFSYYADRTLRVLVAAYGGLRNAEIGALGWDDVREAAGVVSLVVRHQIEAKWNKKHPDWTRPIDPPKSGRARTVALHPICTAAFLEHRKQHEHCRIYRSDGPLFPRNHRGAWRLDDQALGPTYVKEWARRAGIADAERWSAITFRHSKAQLEKRSGAALIDIQEMLGHATEGITRRYLASLAEAIPPTRMPDIFTDSDPTKLATESTPSREGSHDERDRMDLRAEVACEGSDRGNPAPKLEA